MIEYLSQLLQQEQLPDGSFATTGFPPIFSTALIASVVDLPSVQGAAANFLLSERSDDWTWNYDPRKSTEYGRYPDDLDDTFSALLALQRADQILVSGEVLAASIHLLTRLEVCPGGPYPTWVSDWQDVDTVVNCVIATFLARQGTTLPSLVRLVEEVIAQQNYNSKYYPPAMVRYSIARWYCGPASAILISHILELTDWTSPLQTTLAVSSLLRLGYPAQKLEAKIAYLSTNNSWQPEPVYLDFANHWVGSVALTAAFGLEAFQLYEKAMTSQPRVEACNSVVAHLEDQLKRYPVTLALLLRRELERVIRLDQRVPIMTLPWLMWRAFGRLDSPVTLLHLGAALAYGWLAYSLYDAVIDEGQDLMLIPAANTAVRAMLANFQRAIPAFSAQISHTLAIQDAATLWELQHCRLPITMLPDYGTYSVLAERAAGYQLGAIGVAQLLKWSPEQINCLEQFFTHLTIARQLNDDAHDWEADLRAGAINTVSTQLLEGYDLCELQPELVMPQLRTAFWSSGLDVVARRINSHLHSAEVALASLQLPHPEFLKSLLQPVAQAVAQALTERDQVKNFLLAYRVNG